MVLSELGTAQAALGLVEPAVEGAGGGGSGAAAASAALVRHQHEVAAIADAMCALAALCSCRRPGQVVAVTVEVGAGVRMEWWLRSLCLRGSFATWGIG